MAEEHSVRKERRISCLDCGWNIPNTWNKPETCPLCKSNRVERIERVTVTIREEARL